VFLAPSWMAGIHRARAAIVLPVTAIGAALWAAGIGLGAYSIGPTVVEFVNDAGLVLGGSLILLVTVVIGFELRRRTAARRASALGESAGRCSRRR
jgi:membrane protein DedA with SNARE-associated domain